MISSAAPCITKCMVLTSQEVGRSVRNTPSVWPRSIRRSTRAIGSACSCGSGPAAVCPEPPPAVSGTGRPVPAGLDQPGQRLPRITGQVDLPRARRRPPRWRARAPRRPALAGREVAVQGDPPDARSLCDLPDAGLRITAQAGWSPGSRIAAMLRCASAAWPLGLCRRHGHFDLEHCVRNPLVEHQCTSYRSRHNLNNGVRLNVRRGRACP